MTLPSIAAETRRSAFTTINRPYEGAEGVPMSATMTTGTPSAPAFATAYCYCVHETSDVRGPKEAARKAEHRLLRRLSAELEKIGASLDSTLWRAEVRHDIGEMSGRVVLLVEGDEYADIAGDGVTRPFGDIQTGIARIQATLQGRSMHRRKFPRLAVERITAAN